MFLTRKNFNILRAAAEKAKKTGATCTGVTGKHARSGLRNVIGGITKTSTGFYRCISWKSLDDKTVKHTLCLVDTKKKIVLIGFEGTPCFSNYSLTPFAFEILVDGEYFPIPVETSEQAYKLLCAIVFQHSAGFGECVEAILCAENVFAATQATKKLTDFLPLCFDNVFRDDAMTKALMAKWSIEEHAAQLTAIILDLFEGTSIKDIRNYTYKFAELGNDVWGITPGYCDKPKETKESETGKFDTIPGFFSVCESLEFDPSKCIDHIETLGQNKLGKMITDMYGKYKKRGNAAFPADARQIVVMDERPVRDPMAQFFLREEIPNGVDKAAYEKERLRYKAAYGKLSDE